MQCKKTMAVNTEYAEFLLLNSCQLKSKVSLNTDKWLILNLNYVEQIPSSLFKKEFITVGKLHTFPFQLLATSHCVGFIKNRKYFLVRR